MFGVICAMQKEFESVIDILNCPKKVCERPCDVFADEVAKNLCVVAKSGIGKVNAAMCAQTLIVKYNVDTIINVGAAGGISDCVVVGDVVVADAFIQYDFDTSAFGNSKKAEISNLGVYKIPCDKNLVKKIVYAVQDTKIKNVHVGTVLTGDQFVSDLHMKKYLREEFDGIACEMEAGSIAQVCYLNDVSFAAIKIISDKADDSATEYFRTFFENSSAVFGHVLYNLISGWL
jgi:adenosylhomocysteine nucleosidase